MINRNDWTMSERTENTLYTYRLIDWQVKSDLYDKERAKAQMLTARRLIDEFGDSRVVFTDINRDTFPYAHMKAMVLTCALFDEIFDRMREEYTDE
tara:strand:+ start:1169 stop:1456 length:288 start_codon:yes stop_codon:yes gene_type:complete